jgi:hypothetical protein
MVRPATAFTYAPTGLYERLPGPAKQLAQDVYYRRVYGGTKDEIVRDFAETFFGGTHEYDRLRGEFYDLGGPETIERARERHAELTDGANVADVAIETACTYYALIRAIDPDVLVETGVCNGVSTYGLLLALQQNDRGHLYSVDYPVRAGDDLGDHGDEPADHVGEAIIPAGHDPGWFIPEEVRDRWTLTLGLSQIELPKLRCEIEEIDFFVHDSGHTLPCMMFEFELAWNWLRPGGVLLSDDILWDGHGAFDRFTEERCAEGNYGYAGSNTGYAIR